MAVEESHEASFVFVQGLRWQVGNGQDIQFWDDNWLFQRPLSVIMQPPPNSSHFRVCDFISNYGSWDSVKLRLFLPPELVKSVLLVFLPSNPQVDSLCWGLSPDGEYSVKSGVLLAQGLSLSSDSKVEYAWIWKLNVPPKSRISCGGPAMMAFLLKSDWKKSCFSSPRICVL